MVLKSCLNPGRELGQQEREERGHGTTSVSERVPAVVYNGN